MHYSVSNTSGEKEYEEFFVEGENTDMNRFSALGVITDKELTDFEKVNELIDKLEIVFDKEVVLKEEIVDTLKDYLPNFEHIEKGKSLDAKM